MTPSAPSGRCSPCASSSFPSPVMAKGVEDTAFYRYYPLASLNEVGGDPSRFGTSVNAFHRRNLIRPAVVAQQHERQFHARYQARRRCPRAHQRAVGNAWRMVSRDSPLAGTEPACENQGGGAPRARCQRGVSAVSNAGGHLALASDESPKSTRSTFAESMSYMQKALHEAKVHTSWVNPNANTSKP